MTQMKTYINPHKELWPVILQRPVMDVSGLYDKVGEILANIKKNGDKALRSYTLQFDGFAPEQFRVPDEEIAAAAGSIDPELKTALELAAANIERFHAMQMPSINKVE